MKNAHLFALELVLREGPTVELFGPTVAKLVHDSLAARFCTEAKRATRRNDFTQHGAHGKEDGAKEQGHVLGALHVYERRHLIEFVHGLLLRTMPEKIRHDSHVDVVAVFSTEGILERFASGHRTHRWLP